MAHVRTAIRVALVAAIAAGGTTAGANVFDTRVTQIQPGELPAINVTTGNESQQSNTIGAPVQVLERTCRLDIDCIVAQNDGYAAALDTLVAQVETLVAQNYFAGNAKQIYPTNYGQVSDADGEVIVAIGTQSFQIFYLTSQAAPGIAL